jgi:hypothetical protein
MSGSLHTTKRLPPRLEGSPVWLIHQEQACVESRVRKNMIYQSQATATAQRRKFLSEYFYAQKARNGKSQEDKPDRKTKRCHCTECEQNITPLIMSTMKENVIHDGISGPYEAVHKTVEIGPQSRRELTLTI